VVDATYKGSLAMSLRKGRCRLWWWVWCEAGEESYSASMRPSPRWSPPRAATARASTTPRTPRAMRPSPSARTRVRSQCRFGNGGAEYVSGSGVKQWKGKASMRPSPRAHRAEAVVAVGVLVGGGEAVLLLLCPGGRGGPGTAEPRG
jgi:hypothetical protein